ncbi:gfo/Idh/MocA family oxidoreductase [Bacillus atrophaeus]|uniref:Gfo/Idh/MocA family protein n=1 Tax=Bacillus atrophaeus TaxID=1452 RepID=UPI000B456527|nr:Gfo/Idh/MocA family oxidoreductase [Bacillus atrophaeus]ARW07337.1 UDP-N-acetylglucosamine 3-dehydrogenase [Bacillus atrophaeus]ATO28445.1 gfo/Idh/MocA family oxidoreductase [Bacillus atrophaeus]MBJ7896770.1 Gfo/Idh/MocA family oxidoreductase [Bacillus atrophaeus]MCY8506100.1 Gfo/Idh/MocA family oxidoreductase [Bacillus atrophaeus]MCY8951705.1 Gfo/Idh/MocA family oxidoreductase [Bacillus atrophaeus]
MKIGIIGAGGIAVARHIPAFMQFGDECVIWAISDINSKRATEVANEHNICHVFLDYKDMFKEIDAVCICTPNKFHAEYTIEALQAGVHVLCEKPMALSKKECEAMLAASKQANKILAIAYHYRFMKEAQAAKRMIVEVGCPLVVRVKALRRRKVPSWGGFTNKALQGGGSLIDYGCHLLDLALWLMGNPQHIQVVGTTYNELSKTPNQLNEWGTFDHQTFNVDDHVTAYIKFNNGSSLLLETSWAANIKEDEEEVSISGVDGGMKLFPLEFYTTKNGVLLNSNAAWMVGDNDFSRAQARNFIDACKGTDELVVKPEEALQVSSIIDDIYKNNENAKIKGEII